MTQHDILSSGSRRSYPVWDRTTRVFHWINALCVFTLAVFGLAILNEKSFGVSADGKVLLKTLHVYVGYVFAANLAWRFVWGFIGGRYSRWKTLLPAGRGYIKALGEYVRGFASANAPTYLGHNPVGRLMVTLLLTLLLSQAITGLVLAGTDLYMPPFGGAVADWVTAGDPDKLYRLLPGSTEHVDQEAYKEMRSFRKPIVTVHEYGFYLLAVAVLLHILGVIATEIRERNGITSAMISGEKTLAGRPVDGDETLQQKGD